ncbi:hypothetical protein FB567DRAFT_51538 [Paraphoma chrysanthemicola]|uniref:Uncharacterized protein n=1 Tax=Paraphoma chrysanthemicola TaxID=798071 RepID=A0A8K0VXK1_9PLEO|nr:hypothetical protein FB567DRAFT_51538 [Paraphoma chrysanthemicola]
MRTITRFHLELQDFPDYTTPTQEENWVTNLRQWGFTIYRTYYGTGSDEQWSELLKNVIDGVTQGLGRMEEADENPDATTQIRERFQLDARSDPATLDGLTLEHVQQLYVKGSGGRPMNTDKPIWRILLLADAQVLQDPNLRLIKAVAADYDPVAAVPRNTRAGPQRYFGWITMPTTAVLDLYTELDTFYFEEIVYHTSGGPGAFWDPLDPY